MSGSWAKEPKNDIGIREDLAHLTFAEQIRRRRDEVGLSQKVAATFARVSRGTLQNAEGGESLSDQTTVSIEQSLGWIGRRSAIRDSGEGPPRQVLSARAVRPIALALTGEMPFRDDNERRSYVNDFHKLVEALGEEPPQLPITFRRLMTILRAVMIPSDVQSLVVDLERQGVGQVDLEVAMERKGQTEGRLLTSPVVRAVLSADPPDMPKRRKRAPLPNSVVGAVAQADLPGPVQEVILDHLHDRYALMLNFVQERMEESAVAMIGTANAVLANIDMSSLADVPDADERVQYASAEMLRRLLDVARSGMLPPEEPERG